MNMHATRSFTAAGLVLGAMLIAAGAAFGHGDVTPQPVDTTGLPPLGDKWLTENPYRGNPLAIKIGAQGYTQNCARCHGIDAVSGGIAPDLRELDPGADGDEWFIQLTRDGYTQGGVEKMPKFKGVLNQEAMWAIRSWLDTRTASMQSNQ
jgi:cytochrome c-550 PedF